MPYEKNHLTYQEQLDLIKSRGLAIRDEEVCLKALRTLGYYRISAYWYPFRIRGHDHQEGLDVPDDTIFPGYYLDDIIEIYRFDRNVKALLWEAIDEVEIALRVSIAYLMGKYDRFAFLHTAFLSPDCMKPSKFDPSRTNYQEFRERLDRQILGSGEDFAKHFRTKYNAAAPVWVAIELWDFGTLARFYQLMLPEDRHTIAQEYGLPGSRILGGWIQALNLIRNICAHHGRLNRRHLPDSPRFPRTHGDERYSHISRLSDRDKHRLYPVLCVLITLMKQIDPQTGWGNRVVETFRSMPDIHGLTLTDYGVPDRWSEEEIWQGSALLASKT